MRCFFFSNRLSTIFEPYVENVSSNPTTISGTEELQTIAKQSETPKSARPIANEDMTVHHSKSTYMRITDFIIFFFICKFSIKFYFF